jgi:selenide,water dikinase
MVGLDAPDDATVWSLDDRQALVVTTDFFTPVVDDPFDFGRIAAANALSDLYAMGARPIFALNILAMPSNLPSEMIEAIIRGGAEKVREAGAVIAGGHSIQDREPKYGLVAIGLAEKDALLTKSMAQPGDIIALTKPLGTGVTTTALRSGSARAEDVTEVIVWMSTLNQKASMIAVDHKLKAATDVTGFGLLGHAIEVADASRIALQINLLEVPFLSHAHEYAQQGNFPSGSANNQAYYSSKIDFQDGMDEIAKMLLFDAQTSGGLLIMVPDKSWDEMLKKCNESALPLWPIGRVFDGSGINVTLQSLGLERSFEASKSKIRYFGGEQV